MMRVVSTPYGAMEVLAMQHTTLSVVEMERCSWPPKHSIN